jgi:eukaryotic-like serine/threonine-protein kinase
LIFLRESTLMAQALDLSRLELRGEAVPVAEKTQIFKESVSDVTGAFTVSETGVLAYQTGERMVRSELVWFDRAGKQIAVLGDRADYADVSLSPDNARAAVSLLDPERGTRDVWLYDVARGLRQRFTFDPGDEFGPVWSPDGDLLVFSARRKASIDLYQKASSGAGSENVLLEAGLGKFQASWSPDGRYLLYVAGGAAIQRSDLWVLPLFGERKPFPFLETAYAETQGQFSPDGRWIAYAAGEFGRLEVYVLPFRGPDGARPNGKRVSTAGGGWPRWRRDGREIVYLAPDNTLVSATVNGQAAEFEVVTERPLFRVRPRPFVRQDAYAYDVSSDGKRFLVNTLVEDAPSAPITLVVNWTTGLKK